MTDKKLSHYGALPTVPVAGAISGIGPPRQSRPQAASPFGIRQPETRIEVYWKNG
jgi:hypothetical protein